MIWAANQYGCVFWRTLKVEGKHGDKHLAEAGKYGQQQTLPLGIQVEPRVVQARIDLKRAYDNAGD